MINSLFLCCPLAPWIYQPLLLHVWLLSLEPRMYSKTYCFSSCLKDSTCLKLSSSISCFLPGQFWSSDTLLSSHASFPFHLSGQCLVIGESQKPCGATVYVIGPTSLDKRLFHSSFLDDATAISGFAEMIAYIHVSVFFHDTWMCSIFRIILSDNVFKSHQSLHYISNSLIFLAQSVHLLKKTKNWEITYIWVVNNYLWVFIFVFFFWSFQYYIQSVDLKCGISLFL